MLELKNYQQRALEVLEEYLGLCIEKGHPREAFRESLVRQHVIADRAGFSPRWVAPAGLDDIPYVCLRIPTGGGKTLLAAHTIETARKSYLKTDFPLVLWLVPSNVIREQTLACLRDPRHPYREALESHFERAVILDIGELECLAPQDFGARLIVVVGTLQTLRVEDRAGRRIYANSELWERHFERFPAVEGLDLETEGARKGRTIHSFVNLCRIFRPWVILDEAHNARTHLTFETLRRLRPAGVLEMTATPDSDQRTGSNVLYSVSASELKQEDMIKLPIMLAEHASWQAAVGAAVQERRRLELIAQGDQRYLRPIVLFQAENKDKEVTVESLKKHLLENENIPEAELAVATGAVRELEGLNLFSPDCPIKYIITVQALKEGWDCSFAYVFSSVANIRSQKDVEQLLGRVLRLPEARRFDRPELNMAYAHVSSPDFADAAAGLKDRLINMGFEGAEPELYVNKAADYLIPPDMGVKLVAEGIDPTGKSLTIQLEAPPDLTLLPAELRRSVSTQPELAGARLTIRGALTEGQTKALVALLAKGKQAVNIERSIRNYQKVSQTLKRASMVESFDVPELAFFDESSGQPVRLEPEHFVWLGGFSLAKAELCSPVLTPEDFDPRDQARVSKFDIEKNKVVYSMLGYDADQLRFRDSLDPQWEISLLMSWLDRQLRLADVSQAELHAFLSRVIRHLVDKRGLKIAELLIHKYMLLEALCIRLEQARAAAARHGFDLFSNADALRPEVRCNWAFSFSLDRMPYSRPEELTVGGYKFTKHFFPVIQDLKDKGEELECARLIDGLTELKTWVRNVPRHPESFRLPTSRGDFYPDFVCLLADGRVLVVEYKGAHLKDNLDEQEKRRIGELWERLSAGKALFLWAHNRDEHGRDVLTQLRAKLKE